MKPLQRVRSRSAVLAFANIDTDRIIPARFLTTTERAGLGRYAFNDWRYDAQGRDNPEFPLNRPEAQGCAILIAGRNFGCGSSREHAPWALLDYGIQVVISSEIADIFRSNALNNGLLAIVLPEHEHAQLLAHPGWELDVDVAAQTITLPDGRRFDFELEAFARQRLLQGVDLLGYLLRHDAAIATYEQQEGCTA